MSLTLEAIYRVRSDARSIEARARAIAVEQSVEVPIEAIDDDHVMSNIIGRVAGIEEAEPGSYEVRIALAAETVGHDPGPLINMLFGNTSIHDDVVLQDAEIPAELVKSFGGPHHGLDGLRGRVGAGARALTCSALKPQGLPAKKLAALAEQFARGGIDYVKDDHGLADQAYSPFSARIEAIAPALPAAEKATGRAGPLRAEPLGKPRRYAPAGRHGEAGGSRHGDDRPNDRRPRQFSPAGARECRPRLLRPSGARRGFAHCAAPPDRQAVPAFRGRCRHFPELRRSVRLFGRDLPGACPGGAGAL